MRNKPDKQRCGEAGVPGLTASLDKGRCPGQSKQHCNRKAGNFNSSTTKCYLSLTSKSFTGHATFLHTEAPLFGADSSWVIGQKQPPCLAWLKQRLSYMSGALESWWRPLLSRIDGLSELANGIGLPNWRVLGASDWEFILSHRLGTTDTSLREDHPKDTKKKETMHGEKRVIYQPLKMGLNMGL